MSRNGRWGRRCGLAAGLGLSIAAAGPARGQTSASPPLPDPLPPVLEGSAGPFTTTGSAVAVPPEVRPIMPIVQVPPDGFRPTWFREADDPVVTQQKHHPKFVEHKKRSTLWRRIQGKFFGYPEEFVPRPLGAAVYDHALVMTANGAAARLTLYHFDFIQGSSELSPRGAEQLAKLVPQLLNSPFPLIVERTPQDPALAAARRELVASRLAQGPCPIPADRVLVGAPIATGMSGVDADVIASNALSRVQQYGPPIPINSNGINSPSGVTSSAVGLGP